MICLFEESLTASVASAPDRFVLTGWAPMLSALRKDIGSNDSWVHWTYQDSANWLWMDEYVSHLLREREYRFGIKITPVIGFMQTLTPPPPSVTEATLVDPPREPRYRFGSWIAASRMYAMHEYLGSWTRRTRPSWWRNLNTV